ncbi:GNAT domain-containing protein [Boeremia exigua]|uniref:GNAT domain-containing protein n=1 Tax=Boeremia exigua TaxID=749465 RepID=UPI001E8DD124|nr:GNAT domain-containing protein [Boeremia exigua]KAH6642897.1 GNAT domain-containing protein [Boeremia exigua]
MLTDANYVAENTTSALPETVLKVPETASAKPLETMSENVENMGKNVEATVATLPVPPSSIKTPRLHLVRLTDTSQGSQHVQWFHENWSDPVATSWSVHGATKSLDDSREWMQHLLSELDNWFYAIFLRDDISTDNDDEKDAPINACATSNKREPVENPEDRQKTDSESLRPGTLIGSVSLRRPPEPELLPPLTFEGASAVGHGAPLNAAEIQTRTEDLQDVDLHLRTLGYALFAQAYGRGYATEACRGLLDEYRGVVQEWRSKVVSEAVGQERKGLFYVEAGVDIENPASQSVLRKLGFKTVGMKVFEGKVWLAGGWRGPGWWITGMYM